MFIGATANELINDAFKLIVEQGHEVSETKEIINMNLCLTEVQHNYASDRKMSPYYAVGELCWYLSADNSLDFIEYYSKFWNKISNVDGTCNSAYGYCIEKRFGFNQMAEVRKLLRDKPDSRQAIIHIKDPKTTSGKDVMCTLSLQFLIRFGELHMVVNMRSNDLYLGFPYDLFCFTEMQKKLANELGVGLGNYYHNTASMHIYDRHKEVLGTTLNRKSINNFFLDCKKELETVAPSDDEWEFLLFYEQILREKNVAYAEDIVNKICSGEFETEVNSYIVGMIFVLAVYSLKNNTEGYGLKDIENYKLNNLWYDRVVAFERGKDE